MIYTTDALGDIVSVQLINERTSVPLMILAMAIFGTIGVMTHYIDMPAALIVLIRGSVGTLSLLALVLFIRYRLDIESISANLFVLVASGICLGLNWVFLFEAYKTTAISTATLCNYLTPAFVLLVSPLFLGERFTVLKAAVVGVALLGLAMVSGIMQNGISDPSEFVGIGEGILAAVFYTGMIILNKFLRGIGSYERTIVQLAVGTVVVLIYCPFAFDFGSLTFDTRSVILAVIMGVVQTGIAFTLYFGTLRYMDASNAAIFGYVEPVVSLFLSAVIIGEILGPIGWLGAAMILGSTLVYQISVKRSSPRPDIQP